MNHSSYVKDVEKQNETLIQRVEEHAKTIEKMEEDKQRMDYAPVFAVQLDPDLYSVAKNKPYYFVHPCLQSAYEIIEDIIFEMIMTDVDRPPEQTKKAGDVGCIDLDCWLLGSKERSFGVHVHRRKNTYHVKVVETIEEKIHWCEYGEDGDYYLSKLPSQENLIKAIYSALVDCQEVHGYINKKEAGKYVKV